MDLLECGAQRAGENNDDDQGQEHVRELARCRRLRDPAKTHWPRLCGSD